MDLEQAEREKYERIWSHKDYRANSPGERLVPYFLKHVPAKSGEWIVDVGCGTGRASLMLKQAGFNVIAVDLAENCLDPQAVDQFHFIRDYLWDFRLAEPADWFYCCDVLEHIPPEKVDRVLDNCAAIAKGGFFQIALFPDEWYGEVLHLTVESQAWWTEKLLDRWNKVEISSPEKRRMVAIVGEAK